MKEALRRAAVFLGYAFHSSQITPLESVSLKAPVVHSVGVPHPIPIADRKSYQIEFTQWAIGLALVEIDQNYHRYVVSALDTIADIDEFLISGNLPGIHKPNMKNTWTVHDLFYATIGQNSSQSTDESDYLRSLGNARNALVHDSGIVTQLRLVGDSSTMFVRWPGRDMIRIDQNGSTRVVQQDREYQVQAGDIGSQLSVLDVVREHSYVLGDRITLSQTDLSEIIFFYQILAMKVGGVMHQIIAEKLAIANNR
ncbi:MULTISPECIES: hypothetical protein [unclassified Devosia]|uniref:hypothetical protein n=1 Tax=unclassified Devosia TaxID=196773 RepID=UPI00145ECD54|nr:MULTISPECIES: hypothetical protein [unclassified Devosia]MBJ6987935.1 hypothetical protein [Devosia sp. MC521]QMW62015.1 hypothetical protein H4N61_13785 [Devosia sp. MC521]